MFLGNKHRQIRGGWGVGGKMSNAPSPQNVHGLNPVNVTLQGKIDFTDVMKFRILKREINLALSRWIQNVIISVLIRGRQRGKAT